MLDFRSPKHDRTYGRDH
jgi:hypothetical protein